MMEGSGSESLCPGWEGSHQAPGGVQVLEGCQVAANQQPDGEDGLRDGGVQVHHLLGEGDDVQLPHEVQRDDGSQEVERLQETKSEWKPSYCNLTTVGLTKLFLDIAVGSCGKHVYRLNIKVINQLTKKDRLDNNDHGSCAAP